MAEAKGKSVWTWVAIGCGGLLVLGLLAAGAVAFFTVRMVKTIERDLEDPVARTEKALDMLHGSALPEGYQVEMVFSLPMGLVDLVMIEGRGRHADAGGRKEQFFYLDGLRASNELGRFYSGSADATEALEYIDTQIDSGEVLGRDRLNIGDLDVVYVTVRGEVHPQVAMDIGGVRGGNPQWGGQLDTDDELTGEPSISALMFMDCPDDSRMRIAVWIAPDVEPDRPTGEADFTGTPADPTALTRFLGHFDLCRG
jgi:hypothetical protein